jgi:filamentous hemagglutinin
MVSRNENSSGGVGVSFGTDGLGIYAQASVGQGDAHGNGTTHAQTDVTATDKLSLISGGDTTIAGAQATGNSVLASIGGNLNLVSDQDTDDYASKTIQAGAKVMVGITQSGFVSGSGYISQGKVKSTYTSVNDISGIGAGTGGYNITVGGNTDLNGAVITSTADAAKNVLDTGTLSFENLHNVSEYDAKQTTVSGGSTVSSNVMGAIGTGLSLAVPQGDNSSSDTKAGIAQGTITVRDNPDQDLTGLDRNPTLDVGARWHRGNRHACRSGCARGGLGWG